MLCLILIIFLWTIFCRSIEMSYSPLSPHLVLQHCTLILLPLRTLLQLAASTNSRCRIFIFMKIMLQNGFSSTWQTCCCCLLALLTFCAMSLLEKSVNYVLKFLQIVISVKYMSKWPSQNCCQILLNLAAPRLGITHFQNVPVFSSPASKIFFRQYSKQCITSLQIFFRTMTCYLQTREAT